MRVESYYLRTTSIIQASTRATQVERAISKPNMYGDVLNLIRLSSSWLLYGLENMLHCAHQSAQLFLASTPALLLFLSSLFSGNQDQLSLLPRAGKSWPAALLEQQVAPTFTTATEAITSYFFAVLPVTGQPIVKLHPHQELQSESFKRVTVLLVYGWTKGKSDAHCGASLLPSSSLFV